MLPWSQGGGVYVNGGDVTFDKCDIHNNRGDMRGDDVFIDAHFSPTVCKFGTEIDEKKISGTFAECEAPPPSPPAVA